MPISPATQAEEARRDDDIWRVRGARLFSTDNLNPVTGLMKEVHGAGVLRIIVEVLSLDWDGGKCMSTVEGDPTLLRIITDAQKTQHYTTLINMGTWCLDLTAPSADAILQCWICRGTPRRKTAVRTALIAFSTPSNLPCENWRTAKFTSRSSPPRVHPHGQRLRLIWRICACRAFRRRQKFHPSFSIIWAPSSMIRRWTGASLRYSKSDTREYVLQPATSS